MRTLLALSAAAILSVGPAIAQGANCAPRDVVIDRLSEGYGEIFQGGGLQDESSIFEVWVSERSGSWTILMTQTDGTSCIMAAGTDWTPATGAALVSADISPRVCLSSKRSHRLRARHLAGPDALRARPL